MALTDNLIAAYKLDDETDGSGNGNNLTNQNSVSFASGKVGNCASFGSSNTNKKLYKTADLGIASGDDWSISYWFKNTGTDQEFDGLISMCYASGAKAFTLLRNGNNNRWFFLTQNGANQQGVSGSISNSTWYHLMAINSGGTITIYVNNSSIGTVATTGTISGTSNLTLGNDPQISWWGTGYIDSFYLWKRAIDSSERSTMYNSGNGYEISFDTTSTNNNNLILLGVG